MVTGASHCAHERHLKLLPSILRGRAVVDEPPAPHPCGRGETCFASQGDTALCLNEQPVHQAAPHQVVAALAAADLGLRPFEFHFCGFATASCAFPLSVSHLGFVLLFWVATMAAFSSSSPS